MLVVLIPAYEPDDRLVALVSELNSAPVRPVGPLAHVIVVDDGSGPFFAAVFELAAMAGAGVVAHHCNLGKGAALKTGFAHILDHFPGADVVSADCDGQHSVADISAVATALQEHGKLTIGSRQFGPTTPPKSRIGNEATRAILRRTLGLQLTDTQSGLRGYPANLLSRLSAIKGDRFDYETAILLWAHQTGLAIREVPVATTYLDANAGTHFRPLMDSARIVRTIVVAIGARPAVRVRRLFSGSQSGAAHRSTISRLVDRKAK